MLGATIFIIIVASLGSGRWDTEVTQFWRGRWTLWSMYKSPIVHGVRAGINQFGKLHWKSNFYRKQAAGQNLVRFLVVTEGHNNVQKAKKIPKLSQIYSG